MYEQHSALAGTIEDNTTVKPLRRAILYVDSDFVFNVEDLSDKDHYFAKCKVRASFEKDTEYNVTVTLSQHSSAVIDATCDCKQSALGRCSHIAAFLQYIIDHVDKNGYDAITCTMVPCQWVGQGSKNRNPLKVNFTILCVF
jgi:hypothetical protein